MTYLVPQLILVGAASHLVLDASAPPDPKCDLQNPDALPQHFATIDEDAW